MQDCPKCGKKIKTLYERHGAKATYEAMGYYCKRCGILYDKDVKKCANASSMNAQAFSTLALDALKTVHGSEQDRERSTKEPITVKSELPTGRLHERMRRPGFEPGLPDWQSDVLDQTGRPSHANYRYCIVI
jgi:hypothetical protein